ncbi:MAG: MbnP family protein [Chitinophagaceae bacterium]
MRTRLQKQTWYLFILSTLILFSSCQKEISDETGTSTLNVTFRILNNGEPLNTSETYLNFSGEQYRVDVFKFYVSNVKLRTSDNQVSEEKESYHLVDFADAESRELKLTMDNGSYQQLEFTVGVDSVRNVSGAQTGALDPMLGMFWTWNSGYIFAKLEGQSPQSTAIQQNFTYHIGGFRTGENAVRKIVLNMPADKPIQLGKTDMVVIDVDLARWFDATNKISIAVEPSLMTPGGKSLLIADNYATMFTLANVINP